MVDAVPGLPGVVDALPVYRGDPFAQPFQFVDQDTTTWDVLAQVRSRPNSTAVLATLTVELAFGGDPEIIRVSLTGEETALLPARELHWDLEKLSPDPNRTYLKGILDVDPDVSREVGS